MKYAKFFTALAGAVVQGIALWSGAPDVLLAAVPVLTAVSVWKVPNDPPPRVTSSGGHGLRDY